MKKMYQAKKVKAATSRKHIPIKSNATSSKKKILASMDDAGMYARIFLTNLGKYNEGDLVGTWVELPVEDDFRAALAEIGINDQYEEWFISDYETNIQGLKIGEYDNIFELNEQMLELDSLDEYQLIGMSAWLESGEDLKTAIESCDDVSIYPDCSNTTDLAYEYVDQLGGPETLDQDTLERYFDYEAFGRDLDIEGTFVFMEDGNCVELLR